MCCVSDDTHVVGAPYVPGADIPASRPLYEIRRRLTLYPPKDSAVAVRMDLARERIIALGEGLERDLPPSRELSLALTKLEECCYWAIAAIARNQDVA